MPEIAALLQRYERDPVVWLIRQILAAHRTDIALQSMPPDLPTITKQIVRESSIRWTQPSALINATGIILHTNLGRAPLSEDAIMAMCEISAYSDLEFSVESGERGSRQMHVSQLLCALTGAEGAYVTVNNAAAMLLALTALCRGKEVIVSRGEAVEIGGGFRIPVILRQSGARLIEVGTTNRTRLQDYEDEFSSQTGALLHVHSSNFRIVGFTEKVPLESLARLAHEHSIPLIVDNGSGALLDTTAFGMAHEPTPKEALAAGADLVAFSGDKLLGGPQAGILVGRAALIDQLATYPLARALRPDKTMLAGLSATLLAYLRGDATRSLPVWRMISQTGEDIAARAANFMAKAAAFGVETEASAGESAVGGGSLPGETLSTTLIRLPATVSTVSLRRSTPPVVARSRDGHALLDLRTVLPGQEVVLLDTVQRIATAEK